MTDLVAVLERERARRRRNVQRAWDMRNGAHQARTIRQTIRATISTFSEFAEVMDRIRDTLASAAESRSQRLADDAVAQMFTPDVPGTLVDVNRPAFEHPEIAMARMAFAVPVIETSGTLVNGPAVAKAFSVPVHMVSRDRNQIADSKWRWGSVRMFEDWITADIVEQIDRAYAADRPGPARRFPAWQQLDDEGPGFFTEGAWLPTRTSVLNLARHVRCDTGLTAAEMNMRRWHWQVDLLMLDPFQRRWVAEPDEIVDPELWPEWGPPGGWYPQPPVYAWLPDRWWRPCTTVYMPELDDSRPR